MGALKTLAVSVLALVTAVVLSRTDVSRMVGALVLTALLLWVFLTLLDRVTPTVLLPDLQHRAVLITGCDSGFGHDLAIRLDSLGVPVFAGCLFKDSEGAERLRKVCSSRTHVLHLDVTSEQLVQDAVTFVRDKLGQNKLWAVVNNAGVADIGEVEIQPLELMRWVEDVNLWGAVRVTKAFLKMLRESKGRAVYMGSPLGRKPLPATVAYCMSKYALRAFCECLRIEIKAFDVSVHLIEPGGYQTNIFSDKLSDSIRLNFKRCPTSVVEAYGGENYIEKLVDVIRLVHSSAAKSTDSISEVVDEMVAATLGSNPKIRHIPGIFEPITYTVLTVLPRCIYETGMGIIMGQVNECKKNVSKKQPSMEGIR